MQALVQTHAQEIGEMAAAVVAILDPGLLILGGGVGQSPLLLSKVRATVRRLTWETEIRSGSLGSDATIMGAAQLAADAALADILAGSEAAANGRADHRDTGSPELADDVSVEPLAHRARGLVRRRGPDLLVEDLNLDHRLIARCLNRLGQGPELDVAIADVATAEQHV